MTRLDPHFITPDIRIDRGNHHQWELKPLYENSLANWAFRQGQRLHHRKGHLPLQKGDLRVTTLNLASQVTEQRDIACLLVVCKLNKQYNLSQWSF